MAVKTKKSADVYFQGYANHADLFASDLDNYVCVTLSLDDMILLRRQITEQIIKMKIGDTTSKRRL